MDQEHCVRAALGAAPLAGFAAPAEAGVGDLLVAPTRIVLDGRRGTEIVLNNVGDEPATYRISVEFRRMTADGQLDRRHRADARRRKPPRT